jgi:hypothetical protein
MPVSYINQNGWVIFGMIAFVVIVQIINWYKKSHPLQK